MVRQLSDDMDREAEVRKEELRAEYASRIEEALREVQEIRSERDRLEATNHSLAEQRDMYRILLAQADRSYVQEDDVLPDLRASAGGAAICREERGGGGAGTCGGGGGGEEGRRHGVVFFLKEKREK